MIRYYIFALSFFILFLTTCATPTYIGDRFQPTSNVDVYYASKDVKQEYKVIGHISSPVLINDESSKKSLVAKARAVGADGVIIVGTEHTGGDDPTRYNKAEAIKYYK